MFVTDIVEIDKKKSKVYIDNEFAFALYKGELHSYHIKKDAEISLTDYEIITKEILPKRATKRAMNLLKERSYTKMQLVQKLKDNYYLDEYIEGAVSYVESYGYIDDFRYASDFITYRASQLSKRQIEQKLMQKGIDSKTIAHAFESFYEDGNEVEEEEQIQSFLKKKNYIFLEDEKQKQKVIASLLRKGFSMESIKKVSRTLESEMQENCP